VRVSDGNVGATESVMIRTSLALVASALAHRGQRARRMTSTNHEDGRT
jgi:hypothetical protein